MLKTQAIYAIYVEKAIFLRTCMLKTHFSQTFMRKMQVFTRFLTQKAYFTFYASFYELRCRKCKIFETFVLQMLVFYAFQAENASSFIYIYAGNAIFNNILKMQTFYKTNTFTNCVLIRTNLKHAMCTI
jgi:hypothetical protein